MRSRKTFVKMLQLLEAYDQIWALVVDLACIAIGTDDTGNYTC